MKTFVIDASVAIKWIFDEPGAAEALKIRHGAKLVAPELFLAECANILWKKVERNELSPEEATFAAQIFEIVDVELLGHRQLIAEAVRIAVELSHPVYDCLYIAAATSRRIAFVTADQRLLRRVAAVKDEALGAAVVSLSAAATLL